MTTLSCFYFPIFTRAGSERNRPGLCCFYVYFTVRVAPFEYVVPCALVTAQRNCMPLRPVVAGTVIVAVLRPPYALFVTLSQVLLLLL